MAAVVVAEDGDGWFYKMVTYKQDQLVVGWGPLYITLIEDRVAIEEDKLTDAGLAEELAGTSSRSAASSDSGTLQERGAPSSGMANESSSSASSNRSNQYHGSKGESGAVVGFIYGILRLVSRLIAGLLLALSGLILLKEKIAEINPAAGGMVEKLLPFRQLIGVVLFVGGVLFLLINLLHLHPFVDLLPNVASIVTGLYLGIDFIPQQKASGDENSNGDLHETSEKSDTTSKVKKVEALATNATGAVQKYLTANRGAIEKIGSFQQPLGIANLIFGSLHLVAGGVTLI
jgi:hypothetical protein